ncbi:hypothetical protein LF41_1050 [Lysobacter dokdonensis DS-58]|uniref:Uncharacterized protein n=1 Tax=Lysobacter dokdonensis DS-58 TaxID=1300345 RepID=A0A0A2WL37_9GAMM|nr:hypothetical protein [Lysobacter dokdonensis]KGQ20513.1 hypothetical protein LF41_1050 [Lysobacter dokdonensis DS-58]
MFVRSVIAGLLFASAACAPALAETGTGTFQVGAVVLPTRPAERAHADFPVPLQGRKLTTDRFGGSWYVPNSMQDTAAFYRDAMPQRGYRILSEQSGDNAVHLHWERDGERVEIRLQPVLGDAAATRMIFSANAG